MKELTSTIQHAARSTSLTTTCCKVSKAKGEVPLCDVPNNRIELCMLSQVNSSSNAILVMEGIAEGS